MSHFAQPKQILKKDMSSKEFSLLEEWASQTLQGHHLPESSFPASTHPDQMAKTVHDPIHRRLKNRSSSLFEEWKAQAARNEMANETIPLKENKEHQAADIRDTNRLSDNRPVIMSNNRKAPSSLGEAKKNISAQTASRSEVRSSNRRRNNSEPANPNPPMVSGTKTTPKVASEPKKSGGNQHAPRTEKKPMGNQLAPHPEVGGYTAPNGNHLRKGELNKLANGVKVPNGDKAYFLPSFVENPWKDVVPVLTECCARWWE
ncbi:uncharacterized protein LDX57_001824 [Aspergillus melleus]|uniref:uncharacterized protein n=1 Tax=Aspergillus melleus TaxID=138277 RepID=UPI001E8DEAA1|nr:uncharacterized protein LDX57_001824 [Aspergillus melleus]KAH8424067.1 hypothetical protein LDX57_001824 [Aspergillus melleus]